MKQTCIKFLLIVFANLSLQLNEALRAQSFQWAKQMGTTSSNGKSISIDPLGNVYSTGRFYGAASFGGGTISLTSAGSSDIFIQKLDPFGNLLWVKQMGSTGIDEGLAIHTDASGNVYTIGIFTGTVDFDPGLSTDNLISNTPGSTDIFIQKLDASGNYIWGRRMGGMLDDYGYGICTDNSGNVYSTGSFMRTVDFDPGAGTTNFTASSIDMFVQKLNSSGNLVWAKQMISNSSVAGYSIVVDNAENVFLTGIFTSTVDFDPGSATVSLLASGGNGNADTFVLGLDPQGNYVWVQQIGNSEVEVANAICKDNSGNLYITGYFTGVSDFNPGPSANNLISAGQWDIFVEKLDGSGNYVWAKNFGGPSNDEGKSISIDDAGNVYTSGTVIGPSDFDPDPNIFEIIPTGGFVQKLDNAGNYMWTTSIGTIAMDISSDPNGTLYTTGSFSGTVDFEPGTGITNLTSVGNNDIFVHKMNETVSTGINKNYNSKFSVYPNPLYSSFTISGIKEEEVTVIITDVFGKEIINNMFSQEQLKNVNLEGLSGVYFLNILFEKESLGYFKLVKR
jgi:hypothetical protein